MFLTSSARLTCGVDRCSDSYGEQTTHKFGQVAQKVTVNGTLTPELQTEDANISGTTTTLQVGGFKLRAANPALLPVQVLTGMNTQIGIELDERDVNHLSVLGSGSTSTPDWPPSSICRIFWRFR